MSRKIKKFQQNKQQTEHVSEGYNPEKRHISLARTKKPNYGSEKNRFKQREHFHEQVRRHN